MSLEFESAPLSRRERRERERLLVEQGLSPEQAAALAIQATGVIDVPSKQLPTAPSDAPVQSPPTPVAPAEILPESSTSSKPSSAEATVAPVDSPVLPLGRRQLRARQMEQNQRQHTEPLAVRTDLGAAAGTDLGRDSGTVSGRDSGTGSGTPAEPIAQPRPTASAATPDPALGAAPGAQADAAEDRASAQTDAATQDEQVAEVVAQLFSKSAAVPTTTEPVQLPSDSGPIHWTAALALPADLDPSDPASLNAVPGTPVISSDISTIVLDEVPDVNDLANQTGDLSMLRTGTIMLPTEFTQTGALPEMLDAESVELNDDNADQLPLHGLTPKSAAAAVSASSESPAMISDPPKERMGVGMVVAITVGAAAGVALAAVGVGAIFHLF